MNSWMNLHLMGDATSGRQRQSIHPTANVTRLGGIAVTIDVEVEELMRVSDLCRLVPGRSGHGVSVSTVHRWMMKGRRNEAGVTLRERHRLFSEFGRHHGGLAERAMSDVLSGFESRRSQPDKSESDEGTVDEVITAYRTSLSKLKADESIRKEDHDYERDVVADCLSSWLHDSDLLDGEKIGGHPAAEVLKDILDELSDSVRCLVRAALLVPTVVPLEQRFLDAVRREPER